MKATGNDLFYIALVILLIAFMKFWPEVEPVATANKPKIVSSLDVAGPATLIDFNNLPPTAAGPAGAMQPDSKMQVGITPTHKFNFKEQICKADWAYDLEDINELPATAAGPIGPATPQVLPVAYTLPPLNMPIAVTPNAGGGCKGSSC